MIQVSERRFNLSFKFEGPHLVLKRLHGNKFEGFDPMSNNVDVMHSDRLQQINTKVNVSLAGAASLGRAACLDSPPHTHNYNLRNHNNQNA